jgi:aspartate carbamoyltransferase catalytic subunit
MKDVLSAQQFTPDSIEAIFETADYFQEHLQDDILRRALLGLYTGETLVNLFYERSTRTRLSFDMGAKQLGMIVVGTEDAKEFSSAAKGETLEDTIRVINEYEPSIIVLRHHETGGAKRAADVSKIPIINAGDGMGEHPTQALLDLYTIQQYKDRLSELNVVIGGDLSRGRTARSLAQLLAHYSDNHLTFVSLPHSKIGEDIKKHLQFKGTKFEETEHLSDALEKADVVYWTRTQAERLTSGQDKPLEEIEAPAEFVIDEIALATMSKEAIIMHPLPRVDEIAPIVDNDPRAVYFQQAANGKYVRMALIDMILRDNS